MAHLLSTGMNLQEVAVFQLKDSTGELLLGLLELQEIDREQLVDKGKIAANLFLPVGQRSHLPGCLTQLPLLPI